MSFKCVDSRQNEEQRVRVCEHGKQVIECPNKREISVVSAIYGRMKGFHVCAGVVLDKNCESSTSFAVVKNDCQGKSSCELFANNDKFGGDPCFGTNKYLEVSKLTPSFAGLRLETAYSLKTSSNFHSRL